MVCTAVPELCVRPSAYVHRLVFNHGGPVLTILLIHWFMERYLSSKLSLLILKKNVILWRDKQDKDDNEKIKFW